MSLVRYMQKREQRSATPSPRKAKKVVESAEAVHYAFAVTPLHKNAK